MIMYVLTVSTKLQNKNKLSPGSGDAAMTMTKKKLDDDKNHHLTQSINKWLVIPTSLFKV